MWKLGGPEVVQGQSWEDLSVPRRIFGSQVRLQVKMKLNCMLWLFGRKKVTLAQRHPVGPELQN